MVQAVSRRPLNAEAGVHSQASPRGICGGHAFSGNFGLPLLVPLHQCSILHSFTHSFIHSPTHPSINYITEAYQPPLIKNTLVIEVLNLSVPESQKFLTQLGKYKIPKQRTAAWGYLLKEVIDCFCADKHNAPSNKRTVSQYTWTYVNNTTAHSESKWLLRS